MEYEGMVYRPPSEAYSLIVQVTIGCSHNGCRFCNMYKNKHFRIRDMDAMLKDLEESAELYGRQIQKIFLADGDALTIPTEDMLSILSFIKDKLPWVKQVSSYATPKDLLNKTDEELRSIANAGLSLLYIGAESGDDETLRAINKGVTMEEIKGACIKAKANGFRISVTLISGLGQKARLKEHAIKSAELISAIKPEYLGFLTLMLEEPAPIVKDVEEGRFTLLSPVEVMEEMELFLTHVDAEGTVFRSNHASNYVSLRGTLNEDREHLLKQVQTAKEKLLFKQEGFRRL